MAKKLSGRFIRAARALAEMTIDDLHNATEISAATIQAIETAPDDAVDKNKVRAAARAESVEKIVKALRDRGVRFEPDNGHGQGLRHRKIVSGP